MMNGNSRRLFRPALLLPAPAARRQRRLQPGEQARRHRFPGVVEHHRVRHGLATPLRAAARQRLRLPAEPWNAEGARRVAQRHVQRRQRQPAPPRQFEVRRVIDGEPAPIGKFQSLGPRP